MPPCAAADEVREQNLATAVLKAGTLSTTGFRPKERELSAAAESRTTGWWRTATRSMRRGNNATLWDADISPRDEPASRFFFTGRRYNAEVQRADDEAERRPIDLSRSRCNDQLYVRTWTDQLLPTPVAETPCAARDLLKQREGVQ